MRLKWLEFRIAAIESIRFDWVIISANLIGIGVVTLAAALARADGPIVQAAAQVGGF